MASGSATSDTAYSRIEGAIATLTTQRAVLARQIANQLDDAAFVNHPVGNIQAFGEILKADPIIGAAHVLAVATP